MNANQKAEIHATIIETLLAIGLIFTFASAALSHAAAG
jgi:hypothetical protein